MDSGLQARLERTLAPARYKEIGPLLTEISDYLMDDLPLPERYRDHGLSGNWIGHRECHMKPDLRLVYKLPDAETLRMVRMGSHSELFD